MLGSQLKIFVYGTLKPGEVNYQRYCEGLVVEVQRAIASGQLFDLPLGYPAMTLGESTVHGFLLTFADPKVFSQIDELEDYHPHRPSHDNLYNRQQVEIYSLEGESLGFAWVYLMTPEQIQHLQGVEIPSGWWTGSAAVNSN